MNLSESHETFGIDTIKLGFPIDTFPGRLDGWNYSYFPSKDGRSWEKSFKTIQMPSRYKLSVIFYAQNVTATVKEPSLSIEFSFPKVLNGNNIFPILDFDETLELISRELLLVPPVPLINLSKGLIQRIDIFKNHQVDSLVPYYVDAISHLNYPQRDTIYYQNTEVLFKADCGSSKYYDKQHECKLHQAYGILRQEVTFRDRGRLEKMTGLHLPTIQLFTQECNKLILNNDLNKLYLDQNVIANREFAHEIFVKRYGGKEGEYLMNLLIDRQTLSKKQVMEKYGYKDRSTINKAEKQITKAGISMALTNRKLPLPPLGID
jgi:hypothetical protein